MAGIGFDSRVFLTDYEHETYLRRMPVRYLRYKKSTNCSVCGLSGTIDNPIELAHKVPFGRGVKLFRLTPDYLDAEQNIVSAHRKVCNKSVELTDLQITELLSKL